MPELRAVSIEHSARCILVAESGVVIAK